ncbi:hypothetical protein [Amycolatopsis sp. EV170708-02-1]|uniref:hypothetical protein n=1 Tax=Amycolatopsis sp. EV170708-02-1 TaxID=2919322 RepID=UPI001F0BDA65|nr:hypothetical protein [Amycolatopsis sp. EV170708-02-1]UMP07138.1 hypothetical protein MJQ72_20995 [Amycolatopsis sp. EV170708-02-1]
MPEETTEYAEVFANPDGTVTRRESFDPQRVRRGDAWVPIDLTMVARPDGTIGPKAAIVDVRVADGGEGELPATARNTPILVHNANQDDICDLTLGPSLRGQRADGVAAERGDKVLPHEQKMVNESGDRNGCFTCKAGQSGYRDGHWTGDHNPPNRLAPNGPWTLYPHCKDCSRRQGGIVNGLRQDWYK